MKVVQRKKTNQKSGSLDNIVLSFEDSEESLAIEQKQVEIGASVQTSQKYGVPPVYSNSKTSELFAKHKTRDKRRK